MGIDILRKEFIIIKLNLLIKDQIEQFSICRKENFKNYKNEMYIKFINQNLLSLML